ncbi:MAG: hypothetical protein Kow0075_05190 [Salibacteraceae bacterium]
MNYLDWLVLGLTLLFIVIYGSWKTRVQRNLHEYMSGGRQAGWGTIGLSVMATQASAITFLSTPGQAYESGMGFIQFYFGLPLALVLVSIFIVPLFYRLNVYTAYEYLEHRLGLPTRLLTAFLFLLQRGLAAGITIYAPSIVLSTVLGWDLDLLNVVIGFLVIVYTVTGGTKAVSITQKWQMGVIMAGMFYAFYTLWASVHEVVDIEPAMKLAADMGKMNIVDLSFEFESRYTLWSGLTGGLFLALSYFGTDQSQVQRYISASDINQSRMGLMFNAVLKIPMQFFILLTGVLLFLFYQFNPRPISFNTHTIEVVMKSSYASDAGEILSEYQSLEEQKKRIAHERPTAGEALAAINQEQSHLKTRFENIARECGIEDKDSDYVFIRYILDYLPHGMIGLLLAVILSAAMSSTAGELNALSTTTLNDFVKRLSPTTLTEHNEVIIGKLVTVLWGIAAIAVALIAHLFDNLIELVNILGSLFYGAILGIFVCAIFLKHLYGWQVFMAGLVSELIVLATYLVVGEGLGYLWFNAIGCLLVLFIANLLWAVKTGLNRH